MVDYYKKASPHTNLTEHMVLQIRAAGERGEDARDVADLYCCAPSTVRKIWAGETFRHVGRPGKGMVERPVAEPPAMATEAEVSASVKKVFELLEGSCKGTEGKPEEEMTDLEKRIKMFKGDRV